MAGTRGCWLSRILLSLLLVLFVQGVACDHEPTESECRPYIEKALKEHHVDEATLESIEQEENTPTTENNSESNEVNDEVESDHTDEKADVESQEGVENENEEASGSNEESDANAEISENTEKVEIESQEANESLNDEGGSTAETESLEDEKSQEEGKVDETSQEEGRPNAESEEEQNAEPDSLEGEKSGSQEGDEESVEGEAEPIVQETSDETIEESVESQTAAEETVEDSKSVEVEDKTEESDEQTQTEPNDDGKQAEESDEKQTEENDEQKPIEEESEETTTEGATASSQESKEVEAEVAADEPTVEQSSEEHKEEIPEREAEQADDSEEQAPEEELTKENVIPDNLRSRDHITNILKLDEESVEPESQLSKTIDNTLRTLKSIYDSAIKPLELLYKYRDLSNRHFGDPEIFSKPLILFMGPWSGGKSSTLNYLLDIEFTDIALRTGAEPSPAYFNILMYGDEEEILDGTQLAADWTFSGLQKFGQGLLDRLRGVKLKNRLLEKVNIVEIPGILEIRKQVQRLFPFNDACQWFIDRADIIFLVYDPAKLDVGPETEAILDQLKGREYQTRIILNKADTVKPEELLRVQGTLIWNISPLMSSTEPPIMYTTSLWSLPYEPGAPSRLLLAQERAFLRDLRDAIDKRVENKIASARRFAVRVRNHAKMVDCYLTTYYNHKTFFGNRKKISDDIIENPTKYHIYEGLSTLTNISRYDLPDPEMYRDFFRINPLYEFTKLSDTCTYFRGCPINKLDVAIAYDLPELVGKYKKLAAGGS